MDIKKGLVASKANGLLDLSNKAKNNRVALYDKENQTFSSRSSVSHFMLKMVRPLAVVAKKITRNDDFLKWLDDKLNLAKNITEMLIDIKVFEGDKAKAVLVKKNQYTVKQIRKAINTIKNSKLIDDGLTESTKEFVEIIKRKVVVLAPQEQDRLGPLINNTDDTSAGEEDIDDGVEESFDNASSPDYATSNQSEDSRSSSVGFENESNTGKGVDTGFEREESAGRSQGVVAEWQVEDLNHDILKDSSNKELSLAAVSSDSSVGAGEKGETAVDSTSEQLATAAIPEGVAMPGDAELVVSELRESVDKVSLNSSLELDKVTDDSEINNVSSTGAALKKTTQNEDETADNSESQDVAKETLKDIDSKDQQDGESEDLSASTLATFEAENLASNFKDSVANENLEDAVDGEALTNDTSNKLAVVPKTQDDSDENSVAKDSADIKDANVTVLSNSDLVRQDVNTVATTENVIDNFMRCIFANNVDKRIISRATNYFTENDVSIRNNIKLVEFFKKSITQEIDKSVGGKSSFDLQKLSVFQNSSLYYVALEMCVGLDIDVCKIVNKVSYKKIKQPLYMSAFCSLCENILLGKYKDKLDEKNIKNIVTEAIKHPADKNINLILDLLRDQKENVYFKTILSSLNKKDISLLLVEIISSKTLTTKADYIETVLGLCESISSSEYKNAALVLAAKNDELACLNVLIAVRYYADATYNGLSFLNALLQNKQKNQEEIIKEILAKNINPDKQDKQSKTSLMHAIENNKYIATVLEKSKKLDITNKDGDTALMIAVRQGNLEAVTALIERKAKVSIKNKQETALTIAAEKKKNAADDAATVELYTKIEKALS